MTIVAEKFEGLAATARPVEPSVYPMPQPQSAATFTFPNRILFEAGARRHLAAELVRLAVTRPLVVTDAGLIAAGITALVAGPLGKHAIVFSDLETNPTEDDVLAGLDRYRTEGCDGVVAIGGGSAIDTAKAIRLLATHPGRLADYDLTTGGQEKIKASLPPMAAVPTTAGTGSEVGRGTLIQLPQTGRKTAILSVHLLPSVAICDPELTAGLTPALTAGTGMDAFTHCIESYLSTTFHPICDGIAVEGLRVYLQGIGDGRPRAVEQRRPHSHDDGSAPGRNQLPQGTGRRACPLTRAGRHRARASRNFERHSFASLASF